MAIFSVDFSQLPGATEYLRRLSSRDIRQAAFRAVRSASSRAARIISDDVRDVYNAKLKDLRPRIRVGRPQDRANAVEATVGLGNRRIPLREFGGTQNARGLSATIKKGERKQYTAAFDPRAQGKRLPDRLYGRAERGGIRAPRLPIIPLSGPSLAVMYDDPEVESNVDGDLELELLTRFEQELESAIRRGNI